MAGISEFCAKIMIQYADKNKFLVENGKTLHFSGTYGYEKSKFISLKPFFFQFKAILLLY